MSKFLHNLVRSLTTSEKVHFKRNSRTHSPKGNKNYLKIYEVIEKMDSYQHGILSSSFEKTTINKYLSSEVDYLKEKLLISLFNFNLNRNKRNQIQKGILIIEVLANKGFRKEALKKLKSVKKIAYAQEEFTFILRLIELEEIILFKQGIIGYKDNLEELSAQRDQVNGKIQNLNNYHILRQEIRELQYGKLLRSNASKILHELENNSLIMNSEECKSARAKEHWFYIKVLLNYIDTNFQSGLEISAEYVKFMFKNTHLFDSSKTLPGLSNYIYHAALTRNRKHYKIGMEKLTSLSNDKDILRYYYNFILYSRILEFAYYSEEDKLSEEYLNIVSDWLEQEIEILEEAQIQYVYMLIVRAAIVLEEHDIAMDLINKWHQRGVLPHRKVQARLFSIMIHYKLNYTKLIQSEIILLRKLLNENPREKMLINTFCSFMNSIAKYPKQKKTILSKLNNDLESLSFKNPRYFDFISFDYFKWSCNL